MRPTRAATLVALFAVLTALSWGALRVLEEHGRSLPRLSWTAPAGILALGVVVLATALGLRARMRREDKRPHPLSVAQMAVLGKASAHVGPIIGGLYAGYALLLLPTLDISDRRDRAVVSAAAVVASLVLTAAGLFLERSCRVRGNGDQPSAPA